MMLPYSEGHVAPYTEGAGGPENSIIEALPLWDEAGELPDHRQYIFHYHTMMCPQFMSGYCPRHKTSKMSPPSCFCFHFESQRRRPLVDTITRQLRYWDVWCDRIQEGEECLAGDNCPFAHTREEISYHAAKYKTKLCNDRDCRGQEVCCFAHGEEELRTQAMDRYSYWSTFGAVGAPGSNPSLDMSQGYTAAQNGSPGALYHPKVYKHRFCASYPNISGCRRGESCAFAHNREEIRTPLLLEDEENQTAAALTNDFFMYKFKTLWCPIGVQHDWQSCVYAHNYQDARRHPGIGYGPRPCPYWKRKETTLEYSQRCPLGVRCPFSHGAKEQLYHPSYFKTVTCQDWPNANCPRGKLCAFWHKRVQQRSRASMDENFDYKLPLAEERLSSALQLDFLTPPFKLLNSLQDDMSQYPELMAGQEMGDMMGGNHCDPCVGTWGQSDNYNTSPVCNYMPQTPTTAADSDEIRSADSSLSGDKSQADDAFGMQAALPPAMLPMVGEMPWQGNCTQPGTQMWGATPSWPNDGSMHNQMSPSIGPVSMGQNGMAPGGMPPNNMQNGGYSNCGMSQQQMLYYSVQQSGMLPNMHSPPFQPQNCAPSLVPDCSAMLPPAAVSCRGQFAPGNSEVQQMQMQQSCTFWGQQGAPTPESTPFGSSTNFIQRPQMMVEELPAESYRYSKLEDRGETWAIDNGNDAAILQLPKACCEDTPHSVDMPTCNGFIHFKEIDGSDSDMSPTGRPRANSH